MSTGAAAAAPVVTITPRARAARAARGSRLPRIAALVEVDGTGVVIDRRADGHGLELQLESRGVDDLEVLAAVEDRADHRLRQGRIEGRRHDEQVRDARDRYVDVDPLVRARADL